MDESFGQYSNEDFCFQLHKTVQSLVSKKELQRIFPHRAFLLGGQSGAGKTQLQRVISSQLNDNILVINGDEYRSLHPRYRELDAEYGPECVKYTAPWAGKMTESLIDAISTVGYNMVVEGTLRTSDVPMNTAKLLIDRGYQVSLAVMTVKPEISLLSCQIRYEQMRIAGTVPRATDPEHHNGIVCAIAKNLGALEQSELFHTIELYDRFGNCIIDSSVSSDSARTVLEEVLFGPWTTMEKKHYDYLKRKLELLLSQRPST